MFIELNYLGKGTGPQGTPVLVALAHIVSIERDDLRSSGEGTIVKLVGGSVLVCTASYADLLERISRMLGDL